MLGIFYAALREQKLKIQVGSQTGIVSRFTFKEETGKYTFVTTTGVNIEMGYPSYEVTSDGSILILR